MSPATILLLVQLAQMAIASAPQIEVAVKAAKDAFTGLFSDGVITTDQQNELHAHVDAIGLAVVGGQTPPEFQVQPDPTA